MGNAAVRISAAFFLACPAAAAHAAMPMKCRCRARGAEVKNEWPLQSLDRILLTAIV
jgi:hypothetical protein